MLFKLTRKDGWRDSLLEDSLRGERLHVAKAALLRLQVRKADWLVGWGFIGLDPRQERLSPPKPPLRPVL